MNSLVNQFTKPLDAAAPIILPSLARFVFAATLLFYFWAAAHTKWDGTPFTPTIGGYAQIFPKAMEQVGYDSSQLGLFHWAVVVAGTLAEYILPLLIVIGLLTRLAALGMIGFVIVQSLTDLYGHGGIEHAETLGAWFDRIPDAAILDQRAFWMLLFAVLIFHGAGPISLDHAIRK